MKLIEKIDRHACLKQWAIGEVHSEHFQPIYEDQREEHLKNLWSGNDYLESESINTVLDMKMGLIDSISKYITWYKAELEIGKNDLDLIYTLQLPGWDQLSAGSFLLSDAARNAADFWSNDKKIDSIVNGIKDNTVRMEGITLLAVDKVGPYVVVEGTNRLAALYITECIRKEKLTNGRIEVTLGIY